MVENELELLAEDEGLVFSEDEEGELNISGTADDLREILGTSNRHAGAAFLQQVEMVVNPSGENRTLHYNTIVPLLRAIAPANELETMLAVQMIGVHYLATTMMRRAMLSETVDAVDSCVNRVTKLTRTFTAQLEALNRHRGKGGQKVRVEHIHINEGGQAIVGNVGGGEK